MWTNVIKRNKSKQEIPFFCDDATCPLEYGYSQNSSWITKTLKVETLIFSETSLFIILRDVMCQTT
jgi:hypothetical protein